MASDTTPGQESGLLSAQAALAQELAEVEQILQNAIVTLYAPLNDLARSQLKKADSLRCAAVVLAAGVGPTDSVKLRQQRLYLAAALEMLTIALNIHQLLLAASNQENNPNQRSITGSVILTGDYCFTQSAILAAKTEHVRVVEIFSQTLKTVSERILRKLFTERERLAVGDSATTATTVETPDSVKLTLCEAGVTGAGILIQADANVTTEALAIVHRLVPLWQSGTSTVPLDTLTMQSLPPAQQQRWRSLAMTV
ncbi:MAG: hypothetical protein R2932_05330 [Caldilineaceae bacterium]